MKICEGAHPDGSLGGLVDPSLGRFCFAFFDKYFSKPLTIAKNRPQVGVRVVRSRTPDQPSTGTLMFCDAMILSGNINRILRFLEKKYLKIAIKRHSTAKMPSAHPIILVIL